MRLHRSLKRIFDCTTGATAVEYGVILALIVLVMLVGLQGLAGGTTGMWNQIWTKTSNATSGN